MAVGQADDGPVNPAPRGFVVLRFKEPKGDEASALSGPSFAFSFSSNLMLELESRKSVFRRRSEGGGVVVLGSSRKKRAPPAVGDIGLPVESAVSRRLVPGRPELGDETLNEVE